VVGMLIAMVFSNSFGLIDEKVPSVSNSFHFGILWECIDHRFGRSLCDWQANEAWTDLEKALFLPDIFGQLGSGKWVVLKVEGSTCMTQV